MKNVKQKPIGTIASSCITGIKM